MAIQLSPLTCEVIRNILKLCDNVYCYSLQPDGVNLEITTRTMVDGKEMQIKAAEIVKIDGSKIWLLPPPIIPFTSAEMVDLADPDVVAKMESVLSVMTNRKVRYRGPQF